MGKRILQSLKQLDHILRGDATTLDALKDGQIKTPIGGVLMVVLGMALIFGLCMGSFAMFQSLQGVPESTDPDQYVRPAADGYQQLLASAVKVPMLFALTLLVTFPSLYVFNALIGSRLTFVSAFRLLIVAMAVMITVLASVGPIVVFFGVSTTSYPFMVLLNVICGAVAGLLGVAFLLRTLHRLVLVQDPYALQTPEPAKPDLPIGESAEPDETVPPPPPAALDQIGDETTRRAKLVFRVWMVVFALVGTQMSWVLRPFVGDPGAPFEWFRQRQSNFFMAVMQVLGKLF